MINSLAILINHILVLCIVTAFVIAFVIKMVVIKIKFVDKIK